MANINIYKGKVDLDNNIVATELKSGMSIKTKVYSTDVLGTAFNVRVEDDEVMFDVVLHEYSVHKGFTVELDDWITTSLYPDNFLKNLNCNQ